MVKLENFYKSVEQRYKRRNISYQKEDMYRQIDDLCEKAKENYLKLSKPNICSRKAYISIWVNEEIGKDIAKKSVGRPFKLYSPPKNFKATVDFYKNYPPEKVAKAKKHNDVWSQLDFYDMKKKWLAMIRERNELSYNKGYKSKVNMVLDNLKIPKSEYDKFLKKAINNKDYRLKDDNYCSICHIDNFPFKEEKEVLQFFENKFLFFKKNKEKIKINLGEHSKINYIKEKDIFKITLNKNINIKHQLLDLIHELTHILFMTKVFKKNNFISWKGPYFWEKSAIKIEMDFLKKYFPNLYQAKILNILSIIHKTIFEIKIYQDPNTDPDKLWESRKYLLNQDILYNSFTDLIYAVSYTI